MNKNENGLSYYPVSETKDGKKIYKFHGKEYTLEDEINRGGCQGCAFFDRMDCAALGKTQICTKEHKIFMRRFPHEK